MTLLEDRQRARDAAADAIATKDAVRWRGDGHGRMPAFGWKPTPIPPHGTDARYKHRSEGCRCEECTAAHRDAGRRYAQLRADRARLSEPWEEPVPWDFFYRIKPHTCASDGCRCGR